MPYLSDGAIGSGIPKARLIVEPDKIVELKRRLEDRRGIVLDFLLKEHDALSKVPAPGADPCSENSVKLLSKNGQSAVDAASGFISQLNAVVGQLHQIARAYHLVDDHTAEQFHAGPW